MRFTLFLSVAFLWTCTHACTGVLFGVGAALLIVLIMIPVVYLCVRARAKRPYYERLPIQ